MTTINQAIQDRIDALRALQAETDQNAKTELAQMITNKTGFPAAAFNFSIGSSSVEIREADRNWFNFTIYISKNWDSDSFSVKLSTSGTSYEMPNDGCGFKLLVLQGKVAEEMLNNDLEEGIVGIAFRAVRKVLAITDTTYKISREIEEIKKAEEAAQKKEFEESIAPLFTEGAIFFANDETRRGRINGHWAVKFSAYYFRINKVSEKTVKGGGANYHSLKTISKNQQNRPIDTMFYGGFYGSSVQTPKAQIENDLWNGKIGFCSLLPFDHPVVEGQELAEAE